MSQDTAPAPSSPQPLDGPTITWDWLHAAIATALRHIEPGAPLYVTADVLTDELLPPLKGAHHAAT